MLRSWMRSAVAVAAAAAFGCSDPEVGRLQVAFASPPVARRVVVPRAPDAILWNVDYALEVRETECVGVSLSFLQVEVHEEGLGVPFGGPDFYDAAALEAQGAARLEPCGAPVVVRGFMGSIGVPRPVGPVRVTVRGVGLDDGGHGVGVEAALASPLTVSP